MYNNKYYKEKKHFQSEQSEQRLVRLDTEVLLLLNKIYTIKTSCSLFNSTKLSFD